MAHHAEQLKENGNDFKVLVWVHNYAINGIENVLRGICKEEGLFLFLFSMFKKCKLFISQDEFISQDACKLLNR